MRRLTKSTVELNPREAKAYDEWKELKAQGHSSPSAADIVRRHHEVANHFVDWLTNRS